MKKIRVLFVCMGNICRSPTVEAVFKKHTINAGLGQYIESDSAGTHDYHIGDPPDARAQSAARKRGYDLSMLRGRQVSFADFQRFDYVLAMDAQNLSILQRRCPTEHQDKLALFCDFHEDYVGQEVPDPYYGGEDGFEYVLDLAEDVSESLLDRLHAELQVK